MRNRMRIVVFGANGPTGRLLIRCLLDADHTAVAVTRRPEKFPITDPRLTVARADVYYPDELPVIVDAADAVLSVLGVPFTRQRVDTFSVGTANIIAAMRQTKVRRLVVVSSTGAYHYPDRRNASLSLKIFEPVISRTIGKTVYDDVRRMEEVVRSSGLDWTIVRPSTLFDLDTPTGYVAGEVPPVGAFTARIDLARYMTALLGDDSTVGKTVVISTTEHVPTFWQNMRRQMF
jgi:uncharacterized protein YbjT (DUF2867 family)